MYCTWSDAESGHLFDARVLCVKYIGTQKTSARSVRLPASQISHVVSSTPHTPCPPTYVSIEHVIIIDDNTYSNTQAETAVMIFVVFFSAFSSMLHSDTVFIL